MAPRDDDVEIADCEIIELRFARILQAGRCNDLNEFAEGERLNVLNGFNELRNGRLTTDTWM